MKNETLNDIAEGLFGYIDKFQGDAKYIIKKEHLTPAIKQQLEEVIKKAELLTEILVSSTQNK